MNTTSENKRLYRVLTNRICEKIYCGEYPDGENLPPERSIAENLNVSRVTVRKALALLERDGIIERVQGSGNRVKLSLEGYQGTTDIIAVLAHAQNSFFASFIDHFQQTAEKSDSLVLFKQNPVGEKLEDSLFKLYQKNIRNAVIWLENLTVDLEPIRKLRGLGMNMVFFDVVLPSPFADGVLLDNTDAIRTLFDALKHQGITNIGYVGWDSDTISSAREREQAFLDLSPDPVLLHTIPWAGKTTLYRHIERLAERLKQEKHAPEAVICGDGEIGIAVKKIFRAQGLDSIRITSPDDYPDAKSLSMTIYRQDFERMADKTYQCLLQQNQPGWVASIHRIKGELVSYD